MTAEGTGLGEILRQARVAQGISQETLARELRLPVPLLNAIETEDWDRVPPGRERPLTRLVAKKVGVDLTLHAERFDGLRGGLEQEPPDPRREAMERILTAAITVGSITILAWLVVPGRDLRSRMPHVQASASQIPTHPYKPPAFSGPYPVLGEVLPEAPITEEGTLVNLRAMDACEAVIHSEAGDIHHSLRVSEPWSVRVKGSFTLALDNAGVVALDVAGRRIQHGRNVGETWSGSFDAEGHPLEPREPAPEAPPTAPETDSETDADALSE